MDFAYSLVFIRDWKEPSLLVFGSIRVMPKVEFLFSYGSL